MGLRLDPELILVEVRPGVVEQRPGCRVPWFTDRGRKAEHMADQARIMVAETRRRAFADGIEAGKLMVYQEMVEHPNPN